MNAMKDYHDFYSKCGVFLWADVFEKWENNSLKSYGLWSRQSLSTPGLEAGMQFFKW